MPLHAFVLAVLAASSAPSTPPVMTPNGAAVESPILTETRRVMGTEVTLSLAGASEARMNAAADAAFRIFERVDAVMNEWKPDSTLAQINAAAGKGTRIAAPEDLCAVLNASLAGAQRTQGIFDPTWAALRGLWKFGDGQTNAVPAEADVRATCARIDWKGVELRPLPSPTFERHCEVRLAKPGMQLGLGGIAKGWAVDRVVAKLRALGEKNFFVKAGGDLYAAGRRGDRRWRVGVRDPRGPPERSFATVEIEDAAFSTSGDYERFFLAAGRRYHHIIDPRSCYPATASRSATILAKTATDAEVLTKAIFITGGREGLALAEKMGAQALLVTADNAVLVSPGLAPRVEWTGKPSP